MLLTADHGNIEMMKDPKTGEPYTAHTTFDVPIVAFGAPKGTQAGKWPPGRCRAHHAGADGTSRSPRR